MWWTRQRWREIAVAGRVEPRERLQARRTNDAKAYGKTVWF
jgi:hypothetical protein